MLVLICTSLISDFAHPQTASPTMHQAAMPHVTVAPHVQAWGLVNSNFNHIDKDTENQKN